MTKVNESENENVSENDVVQEASDEIESEELDIFTGPETALFFH